MTHTGSRSAAELRALVRERDGDNCAICGNPIDFTRKPGSWMGPSLEHVIPRAAGGTNDLPNLRLAHARPCNHMKAALYQDTDWAPASDPAQGGEPRAADAHRERQMMNALAQADAFTRRFGKPAPAG